MLKVVKTFYSFLARRKWLFFGFVAMVIVAAVFENFTPYFFKLFVEAATQGQYSFFIQILLVFVGVKILSLILGMASDIVGDILLFDSSVNARTAVFKHLQDLDFYFHTQKSTGALISSIKRGDSAFFTFHHEFHFHFLRIFVGFAVMTYFFLQLDYRIVLITLASLGIGLLISRILISLNIKTRRSFNEQEDKISGIIVDNIVNYDTVKLFARESWESKRLGGAFDVWKKRLWAYANTFRLIDATIGLLTSASIFFLCYFALGLVKNSVTGLGDLVLVITFANTFYPKMEDLIFSFREVAKNYTDIEKYFGILDQIVEIKDPERPVNLPHVRGEINFNDVSFSYKDGQKNALKKFDLQVRAGESIALVGRSGSGKTTLVRLLLRFFDVNKGEITIDRINIKNFTKTKLRSYTGVVPQEPILFNETIGFNIGYGMKNASIDQIRRAAKMAHIDHFIQGLSEKYKTYVGERGVKLSGGQKQRVAIARMILSDPDIIIFDEATSQLDSESEKYIQDAFWKVSEGKTTFVIAHRLSTAMKADRIVVLDKGTIAEIGSHEELLKIENGIYKRFWQLQTNFE